MRYLFSLLLATVLLCSARESKYQQEYTRHLGKVETEWSISDLWPSWGEDEDEEQHRQEKIAEKIAAMSNEEQEEAEKGEKKIMTWIKDQSDQLGQLTQIAIDAEIPLNIPKVQMLVSGWGAVTRMKTNSFAGLDGKGVEFEGELTFGIGINLVVSIALKLKGYVKVSCATCTTLREALQLLSFTVIKERAQKHLEELANSSVDDAHNDALVKVIGNQLVMHHLEQTAKREQTRFYHKLQELQGMLRRTDYLVTGLVPGQHQSDFARRKLEEVANFGTTIIEDHLRNLRLTYQEIFKVYQNMTFYIPRMEFNDNDNREYFLSEWEELVNNLREWSAGGGNPTQQQLVDAQVKWMTFTDKYTNEILNSDTGYPRGFEKFRNAIGHETVVSTQIALSNAIMKELAAKETELEQTSIYLDLQLGLALGAEAEVKDNEFGLELGPIIGRSGTIFPYQSEKDLGDKFKGFYGGVHANVKNVEAAAFTTVKSFEDKTEVRVVASLSHPLSFDASSFAGKGFVNSLRNRFQDMAGRIVTKLKDILPSDGLAQALQATSRGRKVRSALKTFLQNSIADFGPWLDFEAADSDGFRSNGRYRINSGPFYEVELNWICTNRPDSGCDFSKPIVKVGFQGANLLSGVTKALEVGKVLPFKFEIEFTNTWFWDIDF